MMYNKTKVNSIYPLCIMIIVSMPQKTSLMLLGASNINVKPTKEK